MVAAGVLPPVRDTWSRLAAAVAAWSGRHALLVRRLTWTRTVLLWLALVTAIVVLVRVPAARDSAAAYGKLLLLLPVWYFLARTKTLSWRAVILFFSLSVPWSALAGWITYRVSVAWTEQRFSGGFVIEGDTKAAGSVIAIAGVAEESLKLLPVMALAVIAARRTWRLATTDWLLLGFASGLAFQAMEEILRRLVVQAAQPSLTDILTGGSRGPGSGYAQYGISPLSGWSSLPDGTVFPGHHVTTALLAAAAGLAVAGWHARGSLRIVARVASLLLPAVAWLAVVGAHAGYNAQTYGGDDAWAHDGSRVPQPLRWGWQLSLHGRAVAWALVSALVVAVLVDSTLRNRGSSVFMAPLWTDPLRALAAYGRLPGERRLAALARGRAELAAIRREHAPASGADGSAPIWALRRLAAASAAGGLVAAAVILAPRWAERIGRDFVTIAFLADLFDKFGDWWDQQPFGTKVALTLLLAAALLLAGTSVGTAVFLAGVAAYVADHAHGAATIIRGPRAAVADYLSRATPGGVALDLAELGLTLVPRGLGGLIRGRLLAESRRPSPAPGGGTVVRNALNDKEYALAQDIVAKWGGTFVGMPTPDAPGIDGYWNGTPVSLKEVENPSFHTLLRRASKAETSAVNAGYRGVVLFIDARRIPPGRLVDFARNGPLSIIPSRGVIRAIWVRTSDGWILLPGAT